MVMRPPALIPSTAQRACGTPDTTHPAPIGDAKLLELGPALGVESLRIGHQRLNLRLPLLLGDCGGLFVAAARVLTWPITIASENRGIVE